MIILRYNRTFLEANTYILADENTRSALVVDTGAGSRYWIKDTLAAQNLHLGAVLLTHGHADHVWDVSAVAGAAPVYISAPDRYRLTDPLATTGMENSHLGFTRMGIDQWQEPENLQNLPDEIFSTTVELVPGIPMRAVPAPGHTEGSAVFLFAGQSRGENPASPEMENILVTGREEKFLLSGDVIFNNGIGRTDLPGGDGYAMAASLRFLVQAIKPETLILPGHGDTTSMFHEVRHSQFLQAAMS